MPLCNAYRLLSLFRNNRTRCLVFDYILYRWYSHYSFEYVRCQTKLCIFEQRTLMDVRIQLRLFRSVEIAYSYSTIFQRSVFVGKMYRQMNWLYCLRYAVNEIFILKSIVSLSAHLPHPFESIELENLIRALWKH